MMHPGPSHWPVQPVEQLKTGSALRRLRPPRKAGLAAQYSNQQDGEGTTLTTNKGFYSAGQTFNLDGNMAYDSGFAFGGIMMSRIASRARKAARNIELAAMQIGKLVGSFVVMATGAVVLGGAIAGISAIVIAVLEPTEPRERSFVAIEALKPYRLDGVPGPPHPDNPPERMSACCR